MTTKAASLAATQEGAGSSSQARRTRRLPRGFPYVPVLLLLLFAVVAVFAPWLAPHPPTKVDLAASFLPPFWQEGGTTKNLLGTDKLGRDILSRIMHGASISLLVITVAIIASGLIGVVAGMLAAYRRGWTETIVMRLVDVKLSTPTVLLALLFSVVWGPSLTNLLAVIIITLWALYARQIHAETLSVKEREYVQAARLLGASDLRILFVHLLPNLMSSIVVLATLQIATVVLMEAALSFLGVGIPPPTPAWGLMIADGRDVLVRAWWVAAMPGLALALVIFSANMVGDWLRDYYDPTLRNLRR